MPFSDADTEIEVDGERRIDGAGRLLAARGVFGLAWFGADLIVKARYGRLVDFIEPGRLVSDSVLPLIGLEEDIAKLRNEPGASINLPAISIVSGQGAAPRLNILIVWDANETGYLMVVSRAVTKADLEVELSRHIRARLMAEAEARQTSAELAVANRNLEEYAAIISHDLKAPLRAMRYIADDLESALEAKNDAATRVILSRLQEQSLRMSEMLTALLDYSSIGRQEEAITKVDTLALVTAVMRSIPHPPALRIELHGEWPVIDTLAAPLDLVLRNLIGNAIAHHDRASGVINVVSTDAGGALEITVADDGPGIAPAHHAAVFLPFRTVSGVGGGHGMGLSFVKRSIEAVNGRIELISDPSLRRGATFRVVWPKAVAI